MVGALICGATLFPPKALSWDPFFALPTVVADLGAATRPFGVAVGDFDKDGILDLVVGRTTGNIAFLKGNGDGTFQAAASFSWKQAFFNAWAFASGDVNADGNLDVIWGANAASTGCSVSPIPTGLTCSTAGGVTETVNDGDVRVFYGNGDGTFQQNPYYVSGVLHNAGALIADVGTDAGSLAVADIDNDSDLDIVVGVVDGANSVVTILRNLGGGSFAKEILISQPTGVSGDTANPTYYPATSTQNSPWGLAFGDADGDGDMDLWVGDRALYIYLYLNSGAGVFSMVTGNLSVPNRPNVYIGHDTYRAAVGYTPSLASGDLNGDGLADLVLGLQAGVQSAAVAHDGEILLDLSTGDGHARFGMLADVGWMARGVSIADLNGDGALDILSAEYGGKITALKQLPPLDADADGISDYVDNALGTLNAPRLDMNTDATVNYRDQLDNDFDTILGNPEDPATWFRLGDPADSDDDGDSITDDTDNAPFVYNPDQTDTDGDSIPDAIDPLDNRDQDGDSWPDGPAPGAPGYPLVQAAKVKWSQGNTRFVIRIDALGRFFQNEFTQLMTDGATLSPTDWEQKKKSNYNGSGDPGPATVPDDLPGGMEVPISLVVIPKQLWTDPEVIDWINDRNNSPLLEIAQHGSYHVDNTPISDWKSMSDRSFYSCETCGLSEAEVFQLMRVGLDTLLGNYANKWVAESGATASSAKIDWSTSAHPLLTFSPPYNTSDTTARKAIAQLGFLGFSASVYEEGPGYYSDIFTPEGSHHKQFDQFGMFHASADCQLMPPDTTGDTYDPDAYSRYLESKTEPGLTVWLIEEVDWSGRPCNNGDRLCTACCNGGPNRENNTVYLPRWNAWLQVLQFVKSYPDSVAMTIGEVALANSGDNAPTVANPDQADSDHNGIGDAIDGAAFELTQATLARNQTGALIAKLVNGAGAPIPGQTVRFEFDSDGNGEIESYTGVTGPDGVAQVNVTPTKAIGSTTFTVSWDGVLASATGEAALTLMDGTQLVLMDAVALKNGPAIAVATLSDSDNSPLSGKTINFYVKEGGKVPVYTFVGSGVTDAQGFASLQIPIKYVSRAHRAIRAIFPGDADYYTSTANAFTYR